MINQRLCRQSSNLASQFDSFHRESLVKLPKTAKVWAIRADGALYSEERIALWESKGYTFGVSAKRMEHLRSAIVAIPTAPEMAPFAHLLIAQNIKEQPETGS